MGHTDISNIGVLKATTMMLFAHIIALMAKQRYKIGEQNY